MSEPQPKQELSPQDYLAWESLQESRNEYIAGEVFAKVCARDGHNRPPNADYWKNHPLLVIDVLLESTAAFDRGRKFRYYRELESLMEYVLVGPDRRSVEAFRRDATGHWVLYPFGPADEVELASVWLRVPIKAVYEDVAAA